MPRAALLLALAATLAACDTSTTEPPDPDGPIIETCSGPPFAGTAFLTPDLITPSDPTTFTGATDAGRGQREMFDRRVNGWVTLNAYLVRATFSDGPAVEVQVNPEFGSAEAAMAQAMRFAPVIGRLPRALRTDVRTVWIHRGANPFGGGNNNLLIHTEQADSYDELGAIEEILAHEAAHTSLDAAHAASAGWRAAQRADGCFASQYARENPTREDVAETVVPYLALRHRPASLTDEQRAAFEEAVPARIAYFDGLGLSFALP